MFYLLTISTILLGAISVAGAFKMRKMWELLLAILIGIGYVIFGAAILLTLPEYVIFNYPVLILIIPIFIIGYEIYSYMKTVNNRKKLPRSQSVSHPSEPVRASVAASPIKGEQRLVLEPKTSENRVEGSVETKQVSLPQPSNVHKPLPTRSIIKPSTNDMK
jgi:hypothetical protein